jgi:hypothetical protein
MTSTLTIVCPDVRSCEIVTALRSFGHHDVPEIAEPAGGSFTLHFGRGTLKLSCLIQLQPGDAFSKLVLGMYNYFRKLPTREGDRNKRYVLDRIGNAAMMIGIVAEPHFEIDDMRLDCIWKIAEAVDGVIFNGDAILNLKGERILSNGGNRDVEM